MDWELDHPDPEHLRRWIETSIAEGRHRLGAGYQAQTLLYENGPQRLVIKVPGGRGPYRILSRWMIRREAGAYRRLRGFAGAARCYGLLAGDYLVLEYLQGEPARYAEIADRDRFFTALRRLVEEMHERGVAHGDLQKKDNLWVVDGNRPMLLDFGVAMVWRSGFAPLNHLLFRFVAQLDFNQWAKIKTRGRPDRLSEEERRYYRRTLPERIASALKFPFRRIKFKERP